MKTAAQKKATNKYNKKVYETILIRLRRDGAINKDMITAAAAARGLSLNEFLTEAIKDKLQ